MASTERLPSGRYRGIYRDSEKRKCRVPGTFEKKKEALAAAQEAEVIARRQAAVKNRTASPTMTWGQLWDMISANRTTSSDYAVNEADAVKNHVRPRWGDTPLNEIDRNSIQDWIDSYKTRQKPGGGKYSAASIRTFYKPFTVSINAALREGIITASPLPGVRLPKPESVDG